MRAFIQSFEKIALRMTVTATATALFTPGQPSSAWGRALVTCIRMLAICGQHQQHNVGRVIKCDSTATDA